MRSIVKFFVVICFVAFFTVSQSQAQEKKLVTGNSITLGFPIGDMEGMYDMGWGIYGNVDYNFSKFLTGRFDLGWSTFSNNLAPVEGIEFDNLDIWEFTGGLRANISVFYLEGRGGYFTGINQWGVVPAVGLRFGKLDIQGSLTVAGDYHWGGVRIGYYWGN